MSATAPLGFLTHSFAGDDWRDCQTYIAQKLGLEQPDGWKRRDAPRRAIEARQPPVEPEAEDDDRSAKIAAAVALWRSSVDPRKTPVETYLNGRGLELGDDIAGSVLRWAPDIDAMVALFRSIETNRPQAVSRTYLDREGNKLSRKFLGPVAGAAVTLDSDDMVLGGLHIAEGVETALSARQLGLRPSWALGSAVAIASFPVLAGVECLTILAENDAASAKAVEACASRWHAAGREVIINEPKYGGDLNDALRGRAA